MDARGYSDHDTAGQELIARTLLPVLQRGAERARLSKLFEDNGFQAFRGDGYLVGFHPDLVPAVVDRYFDALQAVLRREAAQRRADDVELRVRAALHLAPLREFDERSTDSPAGEEVVRAARMVNSTPARALLEHSDPAVTSVAVVLSPEVMRHVVEAGRTSRRSSEFVRVELAVPEKGYEDTGYLRVPAPSGELLRSGLLALHDEAEEQERQVAEPTSEAVTGNAVTQSAADNIVQTGSMRDFHDRSARAEGGTAVSGDVTAARDVDLSTGKNDMSGRFHIGRDAHFGSARGRTAQGDQEAGR
ncbi:hypothetical protein ACL03H_01850 [Saccharopolyspora sp. MS10]|uniref:hypothetical protein n=1 Tax=Saccharopolyspora sp. MS10 TaxID=3385973 RepID=UPI0039A2C176